MCWNKEVSISTFIIICVLCYKLYIRNLTHDRLLAVFIMTYGSMQLFETIIWTGIDYNIPSLNTLGSIMGAIILFVHPLGLIYGMELDKAYQDERQTTYFKRMKLLAWGVLFFGIGIVLFNVFNKNIPNSSVKDGSLIWNFEKYYGIALLLCIIISKMIYKNNKVLWGVLMVYFFLPIIILLCYNTYSGSYWCWYVAFFAILLYLINPVLQNFNKTVLITPDILTDIHEEIEDIRLTKGYIAIR